MTTIRVQIPFREPCIEAELKYLKTSKDCTALNYLHHKRSDAGRAVAHAVGILEEAYRKALPSFCRDFGQGLVGLSTDLIAVAPSTAPGDAAPFFKTALETVVSQRNLTDAFRKAVGCRAGIAQPFSEFLPCITLIGDHHFSDVGHVMIIDDCISDGKTSAAMVVRMRERNMRKDAIVVICCPLYVNGLSLNRTGRNVNAPGARPEQNSWRMPPDARRTGAGRLVGFVY